MIFYIKHRWYTALLATAILGAAAWWLGGWVHLTAGPLALRLQVAVGAAGGCAAVLINGMLHELLTRTRGRRYLEQFEVYTRDILDGMRWPEYITGGLMAGFAEEPLFRGVLLEWFLQPSVHLPAVGVAIAAIVFALCHWLRWRYFGFWIWATWEGVWFGILYVATGSLLVPMVAHALHDVVAYRLLRSLIAKMPPVAG